MRVRIVKGKHCWSIQRRTIFGNWREVGMDELVFAGCIRPQHWFFGDGAEERCREMAVKYQAYWNGVGQPPERVEELPEKA